MNLDQLKLPIGKPMRLRVTGLDYKKHYFQGKLLGYQVGQAVMVSLDTKPGQVLLHSDLTVKVDMDLPLGTASFATTIDSMVDGSFKYLVLDYPGALDYQPVRQQPRIATDVSISVNAHTGLGMTSSAIAGAMLDVSEGGARIVTEKELTAMVKKLTLSVSLAGLGMKKDLSIDAVLKNQAATSSDYPKYGFAYGIAFIGLEAVDEYFLQAFCLNHILQDKILMCSN